MRVSKTISLCVETARLAEKIENFSEWVRARLLETDEERKNERLEAIRFKEENGRWPRWYQ